MKKTGKIFVSLLLLVALTLNTTGCTVTSLDTAIKATDLMSEVKPQNVTGKASDNNFKENMANFSMELFKKSLEEKENTLISPLSMTLALSMTANGADNETKKQIEALLGGDISIDELNEYLYSYVKGLPSEEKSKLGIANSIWFRDEEGRLEVKPDFLQKNADYYGASIYSSAFDDQTLKDINNWVSTNTDGMIDKILDKIDGDAVLFLINAIVFDAQWQNVYEKNDVYEGNFTSINGTTQRVEFMSSGEYQYPDDGKATGFIKPYAGDAYSFIALLPNEDISLESYIASLSGTGFLRTLENVEHGFVSTSMPKFEFEYGKEMNKILADLGMSDAFDSDSADFSKMAASSNGDIYIGKVLHKTYISVDELGTKAGAVTSVEMKDATGPYVERSVILNRPFAFMIIDNSTNLPIFMGTVLTV